MKHFVTKSPKLPIDYIDVPDASIVEARIYFKAGFQYFKPETYQVPHLLEHLLIGNCQKYQTENDLNQAMQNIGSVINATTDHEHITIHLRVPYRSLSEAFEIAIQNIFEAQVKTYTLNQQKDIASREVYERYDNTGLRVLTGLLSQSLSGNEPEDWTTHLSSIEQATVKATAQAYKRFISPHNMQIILAGKLTPVCKRRVEAQVRLLMDAPGYVKKIHKSVPIKQLDSTTTGVSWEDGDGSASFTFLFARKTSWKQGLDNRARASRNLVMQLLFDAPAAIIPRVMRQKGLVYSISDEPINTTKMQLIMINGLADPADIHIAIAEFFAILRAMATGGITDNELASIKKYLTAMLTTYYETVGDILQWYEVDLLEGRPIESAEAEIKLIDSLTRSDIEKTIKELFETSFYYGAVITSDAHIWQSNVDAYRRKLALANGEHSIALARKNFIETVHEVRSHAKPWYTGAPRLFQLLYRLVYAPVGLIVALYKLISNSLQKRSK